MSSSKPPIVMVSWKDTRHPKAGGAEVFTLILLRGLARRGFPTTWLVPGLGGVPERERLEGVEIIRRGSRLGHLWHSWRNLSGLEGAVVIDQINAYPMLTVLYVPRKRAITLIHQLIREVWRYEMPFLAPLGAPLEPLLLRLYRHRTTVTVSPSTAADLHRLGFGDTTIVPNALPMDPPPVPPRTLPLVPHVVAIGRLVRMKRFEHVIDSFLRFRQHRPDARLTLIGRGQGRYAEQLGRRLESIHGASLLRNAAEEDKYRALASASALAATSVREGWGLTVTEAHAFGTPSVVYRVPGLVDSTQHGFNGLVTDPDPAQMAEALTQLHSDPARWEELSRNARRSSAAATPERLVSGFVEVIERLVGASPGSSDESEVEGG